ncbi:transposase (plasmid) [Klebsiella pneumoniae]|nr:transposase [Klebsiella pneumoniae]
MKCRIKEIYDENQGRYGYRRIALALRREGGALNHKVVQRLMNVLRLKAAIRVKRYSSWRGEHGRATLYTILCKCLFSEVTVQAVTELDNKAAHCHTPVPQRHRPFL